MLPVQATTVRRRCSCLVAIVFISCSGCLVPKTDIVLPLGVPTGFSSGTQIVPFNSADGTIQFSLSMGKTRGTDYLTLQVLVVAALCSHSVRIHPQVSFNTTPTVSLPGLRIPDGRRHPAR